ncbi:MAG: ArsR/SmtB family transcription factor [Candidatus Hodarchaeales archaeon]|jgi:DNA-binding transcriptional ArsR family regulator
MDESNIDDIETLLTEGVSSMTNVLKAMAHDKRLLILIHLYQTPVAKFEELIRVTELARTAVANHLSQLEETKLIKRIKHGEYQIADDGKLLLESSVSSYMKTTIREKERIKRLRERYSRDYLREEKPMEIEKKEVNKPAEYQHCMISYYGAVAGILQTLGIDVDTADVAGCTGYGFIVNVAKGITSLSGPAEGLGKAWDVINKTVNMLGYKTESYIEKKPLPENGKTYTPDDVYRAKQLFLKIKSAIDDNKPVILWGIPTPEYGIVNGYENSSYLVSTFRTLVNKAENPINYDRIEAPGWVHIVFFKEKQEEGNDKSILTTALAMAEGKIPTGENYIAGPAAYDEWAGLLESEPPESDSIEFVGNAYVASCYYENKGLEKIFLRRVAKRHATKPQVEHLEKAAYEYEAAEKQLKQFTELFPFPSTEPVRKDYSPKEMSRGAELLRAAKSHEEKAIECLKTALKVWK